ncbi:MAG: hypothetical protein VX467_04170 [Verrucomicrobiota bacterium]|nr:hypothetical protein [Verrucomicrobiota bacterium]
MCKLLIVVGLMLTQLSCTQVVSVPLRAILDKPANVERIRTTTVHDISTDQNSR